MYLTADDLKTEDILYIADIISALEDWEDLLHEEDATDEQVKQAQTAICDIENAFGDALRECTEHDTLYSEDALMAHYEDEGNYDIRRDLLPYFDSEQYASDRLLNHDIICGYYIF